MTLDPGLRARVEAWVDDDPDPETRAGLTSLLRVAAADDTEGEAAAAELADRFAGTLEFGTAGLRAELGGGPMRMNSAVVSRTAAGLVAYLLDNGLRRGVVVGYDARHNSDRFARDTVEIAAGAGLPAFLLPRPLPTPVLAYAIRHLGVDAGVMVTASHNPPRDNGYKVYLGDGSQIVPPADAGIAAHIDAVASVRDLLRSDAWEPLGDEVLAAYLDRAASLPRPGGPRDLVVVTTALHGVGSDVLDEALRRAGFAPPHPVVEQQQPDPEFPTVAFPNPEEPGAIDLALARAAEVGADLVLANDPDADRCAVAVPLPTGGWRMLRGDEVGGLLAAHVVARGVTDERRTLACSIVSSTLLSKVAAAHGLPYAETLTGFKWIARVPGLAYGYEEALGYCVDPEAVADKDGVSAALLVAELAAGLRAEGRTLLAALDDLAATYGVHATDQVSVRVERLADVLPVVDGLRGAPPSELAGVAVTQAEDLGLGVGGLPPTDGVRLRLADGSRVIVRPSGTEPKLKAYLEVVEPVAAGEPVAEARRSADERLAALRAAVEELRRRLRR